MPARILIIKLGSIGDVVHTLPAVASLKKAFPLAEIDWLVERKSSIILKNNPLLHQVIEVDTQRWRRSWIQPRVVREVLNQFWRLRERRYDLALDFQGLWKSAALGYFSGARQRIGLGKSWLREPGCRVLYSQTVAVPAESQHIIDINGALVRGLGAPIGEYRFDLRVPETDECYISSQLSAHQIKDFLILNPGGGWETKNWEPENFGQLHLRLRKATRLQSVLTWGPGEEPLVERVCQASQEDPPVVFSTNIPQFIALVRRARLFVGGDTGPLHLAAACQTPIVGIYGPTNPARNGPFDRADRVVFHSVPCGPCYKRTCRKYKKECLRLVTVDEVYEAVLQRLRDANKGAFS